MNSADMSGLERKRWNWEKSRNCQVQLQKRSGLVKIIVTLQFYALLWSAQQVRRTTEQLQIITALQESDTEVQKNKGNYVAHPGKR